MKDRTRRVCRILVASIFLCASATWASGSIILSPGDTHTFTSSEGCVPDMHPNCNVVSNCDASFSCDPGDIYQVRAEAHFLLGTFDWVSGAVYAYNEFLLEGSQPVTVPAIITTRVRGSALVAAVLGVGSESRATARLMVLDVGLNQEVASEEVFSVECNDLLGLACAEWQDFEEDVSISVLLTRGHTYRIALHVYAYAQEGAGGPVSADITMGLTPLGSGELVVRVGYDPIERIDALERYVSELQSLLSLTIAELADLRSQYDDHRHNYMTGIGEGHNKLSVPTTGPSMMTQRGEASDSPSEGGGNKLAARKAVP